MNVGRIEIKRGGGETRRHEGRKMGGLRDQHIRGREGGRTWRDERWRTKEEESFT